MNSLNVAHNFVKLLSELCIVQVLLGLEELSALWNTHFGCTQTYIWDFANKASAIP